MSSTWQSLIWKEWHEHQWKLVSILAVLIGATSLSAVFADENDRLGLAFGMIGMCVVPLAVFVGLGIAAGERGRRSLAFLQSQPVRLRQVAIVKLSLAVLTLVVPIVVTTGWLWLLQAIFALDDRTATRLSSTGSAFGDVVVFCSILAASIVIWTAATGINRSDEVSAGAAALVISVAWVALVVALDWLVRRFVTDLNGWAIAAMFAVGPGGIVPLCTMPANSSIVLIAVVSALAHFLLAAFYVYRFGQTMERPIVSPKVVAPSVARIDWLGAPRGTPLVAIVWKQLRESAPLAIGGSAAIVGTALLVFALNGYRDTFANVYAGVSAVLGFCIALVVGIGVVLHDVSPHLNTFWRSRPIDGNIWYWAKYATGMCILAATICAPFLLVLAIGMNSRNELLEPFKHAVVIIAMCFAIYAAAVATTCLVRHAVYAAILSLGVFIIFLAAAWGLWWTPKWLGWVETTQDAVDSPVFVTGVVSCFLVSTFVGWLALRNDWGLKSRF